MAESAVNACLLKALRGHHPIRVENNALAGTPDINYTGGWIESKWIPRWPKKGSVVKCDHFTPQQRCFAKQRSHAGGVTYVVVKIERTYLLFRGWDAAELLGNVDEDELRKSALGVWEKSLNVDEFLALIVTE